MADKKEKATKEDAKQKATLPPSGFKVAMHEICLLYTSDAADE